MSIARAPRLLASLLAALGACTAVDHHALGSTADHADAGGDAGRPPDAGEKICCSRNAAAFDASVESCDERLCEAVFPAPGHHADQPTSR